MNRKRLSFLLLAVLFLSACGPGQTSAPTATSMPASTPVPTWTPTLPLVTPTPDKNIKIEPSQALMLDDYGTVVAIKIEYAYENMFFVDQQVFPSVLWRPKPGFKIVVVQVEDLGNAGCPDRLGWDLVIVDEKGASSIPEKSIWASNCGPWVFGVDDESHHFTLLVPRIWRSNTGLSYTGPWYEVTLDEILEPLPAAPVHCTAQPLNNHEVELSWDIPDGAFHTGFAIYDVEHPDVWAHYSKDPDERSTRISTLLHGTQYHFAVVTFIEERHSLPCTVEVTTTD